MIINLSRTDSSNPDFQAMVKLLDNELEIYNGENNDFYTQYNKIENLRRVVVVYMDDNPAGCGEIRDYSPDTAEVKRMYVKTDIRGKGIGEMILNELEKWANELNYKNVIMETGEFLTAAVNLYKTSGYKVTPNYSPYTEAQKSICFRKEISV